MTAQDHVLMWIESNRSHYDRLLEIERLRKTPMGTPARHSVRIFDEATRLVTSAYREMLYGGDALHDDPYTPADLMLAVGLVLAWELEQ